MDLAARGHESDSMSQINPFTGSILQTTQAQRLQADDKDRQVRRAAERVKNAALTDDELDHQVESSDHVTATNPEEQRDRKFKRPTHRGKHDASDDADDDTPRLDVTA